MIIDIKVVFGKTLMFDVSFKGGVFGFETDYVFFLCSVSNFKYIIFAL